MSATRTDLPRIIRFVSRSDSGEYGNDNCAHCGAKGRYQFTFEVEGADGKPQRRAAMAGCIQLFPVAPVAEIHAKLIVKAADLARRYDLGHLNSWDTRKLEAIEAFYAGTVTEDTAMLTIRGADLDARNYRARQGRRY